jgi:hypothetical protein
MRRNAPRLRRVIVVSVLRPNNSLLGSSRAALRANVRAERFKSLGQAVRSLRGLMGGVFAAVADLVLLLILPFLYLVSAYLALDLPARWIVHRAPWGNWAGVVFLGSLAVGLVGITRAMRNAQPVAPVRPQFAKAMLGLSWLAALLCTIGDLVF